MYIALSLMAGFIIGYLVHIFVSRRNSIGSLRVDRSDPDDSPYLFLELSDNLPTFVNKKYVTLKVRREDFISHE